MVKSAFAHRRVPRTRKLPPHTAWELLNEKTEAAVKNYNKKKRLRKVKKRHDILILVMSMYESNEVSFTHPVLMTQLLPKLE